MSKQWSLESVHFAHGYQYIQKTEVHDNFADWINKTYGDKKIKIVDVGGGNGRVCLNIEDHIEEYWCLDLNESNIKAGKDFFKDDRYNFIKFDVEEEDLNIKCDVVYIDSVLTMLENPFDSIIKFSKVSDYTFVNRTSFLENNEPRTETKKNNSIWGGMENSSTLWSFAYQTMLEFCESNDLELILNDDKSFVIKNRKQYMPKKGTFGGWSMDEALFDFIRESLEHGKILLEIGSGNSTESLCYFFDVYSLEEDIEWIGKFHDKYIHAPIVEGWYDLDIVKRELPSKIDAILVDGPAHGERMGFFKNIDIFLSKNPYLFIFDDIERENDFGCYMLVLEYLQSKGYELETSIFESKKKFSYIKIK